MEEVTVRRSVEQNKKLWAMLRDVSVQVKWPVDGEMVLMSEWDWKDIFSAALNKHQRVARGIDGGFVMLGAHTSRMTKAEMGDLITLIEAFGAEHNIQWTELTTAPAPLPQTPPHPPAAGASDAGATYSSKETM